MSNYFWRAHTSHGYVSLLDEAIPSFKEIHFIKGGSRTLRENVMNLLLNKQVQQRAHFTRYVHPVDGKTIEGISDQHRLLVMSEDPLHPIKDKVSSFDLNECLSSVSSEKINEMIEEMSQIEAGVHQSFRKGKEIHEIKEEYYLKGMDFAKADKAAEDVIALMFDGYHTNSVGNSLSDKRFFGGATAFGAVNFIHSITQPLANRIIIKGRSGSGKSTLMRKIVKHGKSLGLHVRSFPCGLDPDSLDMVVLPELGYAILDGTAPHVINPTRKGDHVIDMFERCMDPEVEKTYENELEDLSSEYIKKMKSGTEGLKLMNKLESQLDEYCQRHINEGAFTQFVNEVNEKISHN